jgi:cellulose synthase/poly-beta-1,6-N-acetylglucosamine synthase-like glycosyltransferase
MSVVEFQSNKHEIPIGLVEALSFVALLYGGIVTATLPWVFTNIYGGSLGGQLLKTTFTVLFFLVTLRWLVIQYIALREFRNLPDLTALDDHPFVSILVPAFNEAPTINAAMRSLVGQNYPNYEVIFIDDGSTDGSYELAKQYEGEYGNATVRVVTKPNGGKWSALNHGYRLSTGEFILCVDADTRLDPDTLSFAVARMLSDERIGGLAGQVTIRNRNNFLTRLQALEYVRDNGANRMALSGGGVVTIVPGAIGLYHRQALDEVELVTGPPAETGPGAVAGPWSGETFAEDFQLSLTVLALGWRIIYEPRAVAFTKCPDRSDTLLNQRYRWMRGTWQVLLLYMKKLHWIALARRPLLPWIMVVYYAIDFSVLPALNFAFWAWLIYSLVIAPSVHLFLVMFGLVVLSNLMTSTLYVILQRDSLRLVPLTPLLDLYNPIFVNISWFAATFDEMRGSKMKWH